MNVVLVVIGDGRGEFLRQSVNAVAQHVDYPIDTRIMVDDSGDLHYGVHLDETYYEYDIVHGGRRGMAGAVQAGWDAALKHNPDYVLWIEEDHVLLRRLPIEYAVEVLGQHPNLAQMTFSREPCDPTEGTDQLAAIVAQSAFSGTTETHTYYDYLFSMIPCLIPKRVLELGWPSGPLGVGNETGFTNKCLAEGYVFASWGHVGDPPFVRHVGYAQRAMGWAL